jgi:hypothetical protein
VHGLSRIDIAVEWLKKGYGLGYPSKAGAIMATKTCYQCRVEVDRLAKVCPHCRAKLGAPGKGDIAKKPTSFAVGCLAVFLGLGVLGSIGGAIAGGGSSSNHTPTAAETLNAKDDLDLFVKRYGMPDVDDSTLHDDPRPPIVTRWLVYKKENVKALYVHENDGSWKWVGFMDAKSKGIVKPEQVAERMKKRDRLPK